MLLIRLDVAEAQRLLARSWSAGCKMVRVKMGLGRQDKVLAMGAVMGVVMGVVMMVWLWVWL